MEFNDLLQRSGIDPKKAPVLVLRHSPKEHELFRVMPCTDGGLTMRSAATAETSS